MALSPSSAPSSTTPMLCSSFTVVVRICFPPLQLYELISPRRDSMRRSNSLLICFDLPLIYQESPILSPINEAMNLRLAHHPSSQLTSMVGFPGSVEHYPHSIEMEGATMVAMDEQNDEAMSFLLQDMMRHSASASMAHVVQPKVESVPPSWKGDGYVSPDAQGKHTYRLQFSFRGLKVHGYNIDCAFHSTIIPRFAISVVDRPWSCIQRRDNLSRPRVRRARERHPR